MYHWENSIYFATINFDRTRIFWNRRIPIIAKSIVDIDLIEILLIILYMYLNFLFYTFCYDFTLTI